MGSEPYGLPEAIEKIARLRAECEIRREQHIEACKLVDRLRAENALLKQGLQTKDFEVGKLLPDALDEFDSYELSEVERRLMAHVRAVDAENARILALAESRADQIFGLDVENARLREVVMWAEGYWRRTGFAWAADKMRDALEGKGP